MISRRGATWVPIELPIVSIGAGSKSQEETYRKWLSDSFSGLGASSWQQQQQQKQQQQQ